MATGHLLGNNHATESDELGLGFDIFVCAARCRWLATAAALGSAPIARSLRVHLKELLVATTLIQKLLSPSKFPLRREHPMSVGADR